MIAANSPLKLQMFNGIPVKQQLRHRYAVNFTNLILKNDHSKRIFTFLTKIFLSE